MHSLALVTLSCLLVPSPAAASGGIVIDARTRAPIAGADVIIVGQRGSERTDAGGYFRWTVLPPPPPLTVIVILPDGRVARPIRLLTLDPAGDLTLVVETAVTEAVTIAGAAPTIDTTPGASTTLLSGADLALRHPATVSQALENVPGVGFIAEGQGAVPAVRGLARGRTLILVDGSRASTERRAGPNASFIDPAVVGSIEIARGFGSVAYGSDAFGGVIAVRTRRPGHTAGMRARFAGTFGTGVQEVGGDVEWSAGYGSGGILAGVHAREFDDYQAPAGVVPYSGWRDRGIRVIWEHNTGAGLWSAGWQSEFGRQIGRPRSDSNATVVTSPFEDTHRLTASYERRSAAGFRNVRFDGLVGSASQRTDQDRLPIPTRARNLDRADISSREVQARVTGERALGMARLQVGADLQGRYGLEAVDTTTSYTLAGAIASSQTSLSIASAHRTGVGVFAQANAQVANRLQVSGGLRIDTVHNTNVGGFFGDRQVSNTALAGFGGATFVPVRSVTITAQVARGFRDPTLSDRFYRGPVGRGFIEGNPDLQPETSLQADLVARYDAGPLRLTGAFYDYRITNLVERYAAGSSNFFLRNRGEARLRGAELEAQADLPHGIALQVAAQVSRGRDANDDTPIDDIAPRSASVVVKYALAHRLASYLRLAAMASHEAAGPSEVPTPGYALLDAGASWRWSRTLELRGVMRNLLNESFYSSAGPRWVYAPGRHGSVTLVVVF